MAKPTRTQQLLAWVALGAFTAVVVGGGRTLMRLLDRATNPWAYGFPTLAGEWVGRATSGGGTPQTVYLELERTQRELRYGGTIPSTCGAGLCSAIDGRALTCDATRRIRTLSLTGWPLTRDGARFRVLMVPVDSPAIDGLTVNTFESQWDGADAITGSVGFVRRRGVSAMTDGADPHTGRPGTVALHRGSEDEFRRLCASS